MGRRRDCLRPRRTAGQRGNRQRGRAARARRRRAGGVSPRPAAGGSATRKRERVREKRGNRIPAARRRPAAQLRSMACPASALSLRSVLTRFVSFFLEMCSFPFAAPPGAIRASRTLTAGPLLERRWCTETCVYEHTRVRRTRTARTGASAKSSDRSLHRSRGRAGLLQAGEFVTPFFRCCVLQAEL